MPAAQFRLFVDNVAATAEQLASFSRIRVEQAVGMAAAAELQLSLVPDDDGVWSGFDEQSAQPFTRVRIEIKVDDADFIALLDGPVVGQRFELDAQPDSSRLIVIAHDDSVLLDRDEKVAVFENVALATLVKNLIEEPGSLTSRIAPGLPDAASAVDRFIVQRGTNMQTLRSLAKRFGMFVYVEPGDTPGQSVGIFEAAAARDEGLPGIILLGADRNIATFSAEFDALRPQTAKAGMVRAIDKEQLSGSAATASEAALGDEAAHAIVVPAATLLSQTREEQSDLDAAAAAVVDISSWAFSARGEVDSDLYAGVLRPYRKLTVTGVGPQLSGDYMVARVLHEIDDSGYRQSFSLSRNARSAGDSGGGTSTSGVF
jgi:phage protein D